MIPGEGGRGASMRGGAAVSLASKGWAKMG
jgi:hypothetical protein